MTQSFLLQTFLQGLTRGLSEDTAPKPDQGLSGEVGHGQVAQAAARGVPGAPGPGMPTVNGESLVSFNMDQLCWGWVSEGDVAEKT